MSETTCKSCFILGQRLELAQQEIRHLREEIGAMEKMHARDMNDTISEMEREHNRELREAMAEARYEAQGDMGWPHG